MSEKSDVSRETSRETSQAPRRDKRSSVYIYLVILFGAAFLMLLLAYFVQQRNSAAALSDLRSTTNASREELLADIQTLEGENEQLRQDVARLQKSFEDSEAQAQTLARRLQETSDQLTAYDLLNAGYEKYVGYTSVLQTLYASEVKLAAKDYQGAAEALTGIEYSYFTSTIDLYDAELTQTEAMRLRPRFDALVSALAERGALDEGWTGAETP